LKVIAAAIKAARESILRSCLCALAKRTNTKAALSLHRVCVSTKPTVVRIHDGEFALNFWWSAAIFTWHFYQQQIATTSARPKTAGALLRKICEIAYIQRRAGERAGALHAQNYCSALS